jgi:hypothetical protein
MKNWSNLTKFDEEWNTPGDPNSSVAWLNLDVYHCDQIGANFHPLNDCLLSEVFRKIIVVAQIFWLLSSTDKVVC